MAEKSAIRAVFYEEFTKLFDALKVAAAETAQSVREKLTEIQMLVDVVNCTGDPDLSAIRKEAISKLTQLVQEL